jgi:hypothetical protein
MAHVASKRVSLDEIWPDLEDGITSLVTNLNAGFPRKRWMELYSYVSSLSLAASQRLQLPSALRSMHFCVEGGGVRVLIFFFSFDNGLLMLRAAAHASSYTTETCTTTVPRRALRLAESLVASLEPILWARSCTLG